MKKEDLHRVCYLLNNAIYNNFVNKLGLELSMIDEALQIIKKELNQFDFEESENE